MDEWISVQEELPKNLEWVLFFIPKRNRRKWMVQGVFVGYLFKQNDFIEWTFVCGHWSCDMKNYHVTHWKKLPTEPKKPYKKRKKL